MGEEGAKGIEESFFSSKIDVFQTKYQSVDINLSDGEAIGRFLFAGRRMYLKKHISQKAFHFVKNVTVRKWCCSRCQPVLMWETVLKKCRPNSLDSWLLSNQK